MKTKRWIESAVLGLGLTLGGMAAPESTAQTGTGEPEQTVAPVATVEEEVFVADSLPYTPTSSSIATKLPVDLAWTPANVGLVDQGVLAEQNAHVLIDALANISGMNIQTGAGIFDFFVVRGFDSLNGSLILTDGAPEPESTFYQMYNVERVEVLKGPGGFLYGSNPLAGAVNIVRKQPVPDNFGTVGVEAGSFGTYGGQLDLNRGSAGGNVDFRLNALYRESEGYREGKDSRVWGFNPAVTWRPSDRTSLHFNAEWLDYDATPDAGLPLLPLAGGALPNVSRDNAYESPFDNSNQEIGRYQVDFEHQFSDRLTLRNKTYYRGLDWKTDGTLLFGAFPVSATSFIVQRALTLLDDRQAFYGNQLEAVVSAQTGGISHKIVAGVELARNTDDYTIDVGLLDPIDLFNPVNGNTPPFVFPNAAGETTADIVAPYVIDQMAFSDQFQVLAGLRFDSIDFEDDVTGTSRSDSKASPMLGVVYSPQPGLALYANGSSSFAPPSPRVVGERKPEESQEVEVGVRKELMGGRLRSTFSLYQLERDNIAIPDDNGVTQQAGDQRSRGGEIELAAELGSRLNAVFSYAYNDSELTRFAESVQVSQNPPFSITFDRSGNTAAFAPEHVANLWLSKRLAGGFGLGGGARYISSQFIAEDNVTEIEDYVLLNAAAWYTLGDWRLTVNVKNLTDEEYETRAFGASSVIPGEPLNVSLRVDYKL